MQEIHHKFYVCSFSAWMIFCALDRLTSNTLCLAFNNGFLTSLLPRFSLIGLDVLAYAFHRNQKVVQEKIKVNDEEETKEEKVDEKV